MTAEDPLRFHRLPRLRRVEAHDLARLLQAVNQLGVVAEVNDQPLLGADVHSLGHLERRRPASLDALPDLIEAIFQLVGGVRAEGQNTAGG